MNLPRVSKCPRPGSELKSFWHTSMPQALFCLPMMASTPGQWQYNPDLLGGHEREISWACHHMCLHLRVFRVESPVAVHQFSHVQLFATPWTACSRGSPVHHQLPELAQTPVHWASDAIQSSHPLSSPSPPAFNLSQHQGLFLMWVSSKVLEFQLQH